VTQNTSSPDIADVPITSLPTERRRSRAGRAGGRGWRGFLIERLVGLVLIAVVLAFGTFMMVRLIPGDPAAYIAGSSGTSGVTSTQVEKIRVDLGLDESFLTQLKNYLGDIVRGDFGDSSSSASPSRG
jgi:ABC-type dipeptide/oligopeptide/nickel transport system permease component